MLSGCCLVPMSVSNLTTHSQAPDSAVLGCRTSAVVRDGSPDSPRSLYLGSMADEMLEARGAAVASPSARGRPPLVPNDVLGRIRAERAEGASLHQIAAGLNADRTPTALNGTQWWPSSIRSALARSDPSQRRRKTTLTRVRRSSARAVDHLFLRSLGLRSLWSESLQGVSRTLASQRGRVFRSVLRPPARGSSVFVHAVREELRGGEQLCLRHRLRRSVPASATR